MCVCVPARRGQSGLSGAGERVGRGKHSPTPYFCLLVGIQRAMATTSPRGASGYSHSCSERRCAGRTPPPCSGKTWATLARRPRLRRPASLAPGAPHAHPPARPRSPAGASGRAAPRALPCAAPAPPAGRALCALGPPASPAGSASPGWSRSPELPGLSSQRRLCDSPALPGCAAERGGGGAGESHRRLRTLSKYLLNE